MKLKNTVVLSGLLLTAGSALAADFDFSGNFTKDNDIAKFSFSVGASSTVTIFSSSWVGGGFDPILAIWAVNGALISEQDDGHNIGATLSNGTSYSHGNWDSYYSVTLAPGDYFATVAQFDNFAKGSTFAAGFKYDSNPNFTFANGYGSQPYFNGVQSTTDARTSDYAFHILGVTQANHLPPNGTVPDGGSSLMLLGLGIAGVVGMRKGFSKK